MPISDSLLSGSLPLDSLSTDSRSSGALHKSAARSFVVVFNPVPNKARQIILEKLINELKFQGLHYHLYPTEANLSANQSFFNRHKDEFSDIIIVGGDGTFNMIINCLELGPETPSIGLLPAGTGNDFARRWYDSSDDPDQSVGRTYGEFGNTDNIIQTVLGLKTKALYLGECKMTHNTRLFHNVLGVGFDAKIAKRLTGKKTLFQGLSYTLAGIRYIPFYKELNTEITLPSGKFAYKNLVTVFANSQFFGGGLPIAPMAHGQDPHLDVIRAPKLKMGQKLMLFIKLILGRHMTSKHISYERMNLDHQAEIKTEGLDIEADGEYIGTTPCRVKMSPHTLKLKV